MIDLGIVRPGTTIRIPFSSFDKDDGSSITMTNYAVANILVYKDGNTTAKADTTAFTATTDFSSKTGKHLDPHPDPLPQTTGEKRVRSAPSPFRKGGGRE